MTKIQIKKLAILGYHLTSENPLIFTAGGQFSGGYWNVSAEEALKSLQDAEQLNKVWINKFGKKLYEI